MLSSENRFNVVLLIATALSDLLEALPLAFGSRSVCFGGVKKGRLYAALVNPESDGTLYLDKGDVVGLNKGSKIIPLFILMERILCPIIS